MLTPKFKVGDKVLNRDREERTISRIVVLYLCDTYVETEEYWENQLEAVSPAVDDVEAARELIAEHDCPNVKVNDKGEIWWSWANAPHGHRFNDETWYDRTSPEALAAVVAWLKKSVEKADAAI